MPRLTFFSLLFCLASVLQSRGHTPDTTLHELELKVKNGHLSGSLIKAGTDKLAILIAGSGPTDRNGNNPYLHTDNLKSIAEGLALQGISSFRFDKRGIGLSQLEGFREDSLTIDTLVKDAVNWARSIKEEQGFGELYFIGHSEGALIATLAAQQVKTEGLVLLCGAGRSADAILKDQLRVLPDTLYATASDIIDQIRTGNPVNNIPYLAFHTLFRPSVQPYLYSWFRYDPAAELAKTDCPALVLSGQMDIQVKAPEAKILSSIKKNVRLVEMDSMNHALQKVPSEYTVNPDLPVHQQLLDNIIEFIQDQE